MSNKRIAKNTITAYIRTVVNILLALFSVRWILNALGSTDYGILVVVNAIVLFFTFVNGVLSVTVTRFYAHAIGRNDKIELDRLFNSALRMNICLAVILLIIGLPAGDYIIDHAVNLPSTRNYACLLTFRLNLVSGLVSILAVPFLSMFSARQRISELALWGIVQSFLVFVLAYSINIVAGDKLVLYALGMFIIVVFMQMILICRAIITFGECRLNLQCVFDNSHYSSMLGFAAWYLIGSFGALLRDQGSVILLNSYFGPAINAAYGIANQVSTQVGQLSVSMMGAFTPEITSSEGRGDRVRLFSLMHYANTYGTILMTLIAVPLIINIDYILDLWLVFPPHQTALFCKVIIIMLIVEKMTGGYALAVMAQGKIAAYQVTVGSCLLMTLPISWVLLQLKYPAISIGYSAILTMMIVSIGRLFWVKYFFKITLSSWLRNSLRPISVVTISLTFTAIIPSYFTSSPPIELISSVILAIVAAFFSCYFFILSCDERMSLKIKINDFLRNGDLGR